MKEILVNGAARFGISISVGCAEKFETYARLLREWNEKMNLTAIVDDRDIAVKHFLDSLSLFSTGKLHGKIIDVGTGAGFPGLALKIADPSLDVTLLDSLNKRLGFLQAVCNELCVDDVTLIHSRAEDGARRAELRESFDVVTARAVANLTLLSELCLPYVKVGGYFLAMKGPAAAEELEAAKRAVAILGGAVEDIYDAEIEDGSMTRRIIAIKKVRQTPVKFPRKPALISKAPIETCYKINKKHAK